MTYWRNRFEPPRYASDVAFGLIVFGITFAISILLIGIFWQ